MGKQTIEEMHVGRAELGEILELVERGLLAAHHAEACGVRSVPRAWSVERVDPRPTSGGLGVEALDGWRGQAIGSQVFADLWRMRSIIVGSDIYVPIVSVLQRERLSMGDARKMGCINGLT